MANENKHKHNLRDIFAQIPEQNESPFKICCCDLRLFSRSAPVPQNKRKAISQNHYMYFDPRALFLNARKGETNQKQDAF